jgi:hypothetical protein
MGKVVFGLLAIAIGLALQGCSADTTIYAVSVAAPQLKIDQIPLNLKGASSVEIDFKSQVTSSQKQITAIQFLYSADGTHFMPVETLSADATSYQWSVPHIDSTAHANRAMSFFTEVV